MTAPRPVPRPVPQPVADAALRIAGDARWATAGAPRTGPRAWWYAARSAVALTGFWRQHRHCPGFREVETPDLFGYWCDSHQTGAAA